jgi:hypothetical protein
MHRLRQRHQLHTAQEVFKSLRLDRLAGCLESDQIHQRFYSERTQVSPELLYVSYGPRNEEPWHRPSTDATAWRNL